MIFGQIKVHLYIGTAVFLFLALIGLASDVSFTASLYRGMLGGVLFTLLSIALYSLAKATFFYKTEDIENKLTNSKMDLVISDDGVSETVSFVHKQEEQQNFEPLQAGQIDPQVSRIINEDPQRMAEMVRKMGLDE